MSKTNFLAPLLLAVCLVQCQTVQEKNQELLKDREVKLKSLKKWKATECRVTAHLTQPALARYRQMFPGEEQVLEKDGWTYTWSATRDGCSVSTVEKSPLLKNHHGFMQSAFCVLLQSYWVNSPFAGLDFDTGDVVSDGDAGRVHIRTSPDLSLGLYLDPNSFQIETKTKSLGSLLARYMGRDNRWIPENLEQRTEAAKLVLDDFSYDKVQMNGRPLLKAFWLSVGGGDKLLQHTRVEIGECRNI